MRSTPSVHREEVAKRVSPGMTPDLTPAGATAAHYDHDTLGHVVPPFLLLLIFGILMGLTVMTVAVTKIDFGYNINLIIALSIAVVKAMLVVMYFMHLRWDSPLYSIVVFGCMGFVMLFIAFTIMDTGQYRGILSVQPPK